MLKAAASTLAVLALLTPASPASSIFVPLTPSGFQWAIQPSNFRPAIGLSLGYMTWRGWGRYAAIGRGLTFVGHNRHGANATVRLAGFVRCEHRRYYARMTVTSGDVGQLRFRLVHPVASGCRWRPV